MEGKSTTRTRFNPSIKTSSLYFLNCVTVPIFPLSLCFGSITATRSPTLMPQSLHFTLGTPCLKFPEVVPYVSAASPASRRGAIGPSSQSSRRASLATLMLSVRLELRILLY